MTFNEWEMSISKYFREDSLWNLKVYRLSLFLTDIGWYDVTKLIKDKRTIGLSDQLYRALGSISANIEEGYSRGSNKDRTRFYEYSLGSARETRGWYYRGRHVLGKIVVQHRLKLLSEIIRLLLTIIPQERGYTVSDKAAFYPTSKNANFQEILTPEELEILLNNVPLPLL